MRKLHKEVVEGLGNPDILFNNAGVTGTRTGPQGDIQLVSPEEFESTWRTNTGTHYLVSYTIVLALTDFTQTQPT